jgi:uncharacterized protein (TIGR03000 family)
MFQKVLTYCGLPTLAAAAILLTADPSQAAGHGGGGHFGGGFHAGFARGGYSRGYSGYSRGYGGYSRGYYPSHGYRSNYGYGRNYGYRRYGYGYYPSYGSYPYYGSYYNSYPYYGSYPNYENYLYDTSDPYYSTNLGSDSANGSADTSSNGNSGPSYPVATETNGTQSDSPVNITVRVHANAELWFDGTKTKSTGAVRKFRSPPLESGRQYTYDVRARWKDNGRTVTQTRHLNVSAGDQITVRFPVRSKTQE